MAKKITENVVPDMQKLGIEVVNFNIQNFRDNAGTIENMGIDNVEQIRKNAQIAKANAQRDIAIASSRAQQEANAVKVDSEKNMAEQNAELAVQQAEMQVRADTKKAEADAAYSIQQENQRKTIEITRANADIARREKEAELAEKEIAIKERQLEAEVTQGRRRGEISGPASGGSRTDSPAEGSRGPEIRGHAAGGSPPGRGRRTAIRHGAGGRGHSRQGSGGGGSHREEGRRAEAAWAKPPFWKWCWPRCRKW